MSTLSNKIDFAVILRVDHANPNGDPLNGNRPRTDYSGLGEITDVCLKRKMRDRLQETGHNIFVQSDDRSMDGMKSLRNRAEHEQFGLGKQAFVFSAKKAKSKKNAAETGASAVDEEEQNKKERTALAACAKWFDVRAFGNLFAWESKAQSAESEDADSSNSKGVSIPIRGPVSVQTAFSVEPVEVTSTQITKSVSGEGDGTKRGSDTMGMKHRVDRAVYVFRGSMNPQLAERTGFSDDDAEAIKQILPRLFENDASSARPEGSMSVLKVLWWRHSSRAGQFSSARVHATLKVAADGGYTLENLDGLAPEEIDGF